MPEEIKDEPVLKTQEELAAEEGEIDFSNPDATPHKYNIFSAEQTNRITKEVERFVDELMATDIPFAFVEIATQILNGKLRIVKAKAKAFEKANRMSNLAHLTPANKLELYETIEESNEALEDLDD